MSSTTAPPRPARARWALRIAGPTALGAAVVLLWGSQRGPTEPDLPRYELGGGEAGAARLVSRAGPGARFELALRPVARPAERVVAYAFAFGDGLEPAPLEATIDLAPDGAVRVAGDARALRDARDVRIVIGAPAAIGKFDDAIERARRAEGDGRVRVVVVPIE